LWFEQFRARHDNDDYEAWKMNDMTRVIMMSKDWPFAKCVAHNVSASTVVI
jgi:hypothetical protein